MKISRCFKWLPSSLVLFALYYSGQDKHKATVNKIIEEAGHKSVRKHAKKSYALN
jgi:hypothetical protein